VTRRARASDQAAQERALRLILADLKIIVARLEALLGMPEPPTANTGSLVVFRVRPVWLGEPQDRPAFPMPAEDADREARLRALLQEALRLLGASTGGSGRPQARNREGDK